MPLSTKLHAEYVELINQALDAISVQKPTDFRAVTDNLQKILSAQDYSQLIFNPELDVVMQSLVEYLEQPELFVKSSEDYEEYRNIILTRIQAKITEFDTFSPKQKYQYVQAQKQHDVEIKLAKKVINDAEHKRPNTQGVLSDEAMILAELGEEVSGNDAMDLLRLRVTLLMRDLASLDQWSANGRQERDWLIENIAQLTAFATIPVNLTPRDRSQRERQVLEALPQQIEIVQEVIERMFMVAQTNFPINTDAKLPLLRNVHYMLTHSALSLPEIERLDPETIGHMASFSFSEILPILNMSVQELLSFDTTPATRLQYWLLRFPESVAKFATELHIYPKDFATTNLNSLTINEILDKDNAELFIRLIEERHVSLRELGEILNARSTDKTLSNKLGPILYPSLYPRLDNVQIDQRVESLYLVMQAHANRSLHDYMQNRRSTNSFFSRENKLLAAEKLANFDDCSSTISKFKITKAEYKALTTGELKAVAEPKLRKIRDRIEIEEAPPKQPKMR